MVSIQPLTGLRCQHCQAQITHQGVCWRCQRYPLALSGLRTVSTYTEPLRSCIHALKYAGNKRLAEPLGLLLAQTYRSTGLQADYILPIPLHHERQKQRGYNQASLLARVCAAHLGVTIRENLVIRKRSTVAQVGLKPHERQQNVAGAFACVPDSASTPLYKQNILLIDDVCTTGATLAACAAPLFSAGAASVWGLVLARPQ
jgi:ComF family protein